MDERYECPACGWTATEPKEYDHCPNCLCATHEEDEEGYECGGTLEPISVWVKSETEWEIIQRCRLCGELVSTPMSREDSMLKILSVAAKPLACPPFPLEKAEQLSELTGKENRVGGEAE